jgi:hypothetical protein
MNYITIFQNLPYKVKGFLLYDSVDDFYTIVLNSRSSFEANQATFEHELQHILNGDIVHNRNVAILETVMH